MSIFLAYPFLRPWSNRDKRYSRKYVATWSFSQIMRPMGRRWSQFPYFSARRQFALQDHWCGTSASHGVPVCVPRLSLLAYLRNVKIQTRRNFVHSVDGIYTISISLYNWASMCALINKTRRPKLNSFCLSVVDVCCMHSVFIWRRSHPLFPRLSEQL